jgi:hypothetical protein
MAPRSAVFYDSDSHSTLALSITLPNEDEFCNNESDMNMKQRLNYEQHRPMLREIVAISHVHVSFVLRIHLNIHRHCSAFHQRDVSMFVRFIFSRAIFN